MKKEKAKECLSLRDLFIAEKAKIVRQCELCAACLKVCPVYPLTSFSNERPAHIMKKALEALEGKPSEVARELAYSCTNCAVCIDSCPVDLNPYHLQEILRAELVSCGHEFPLTKPRIGDREYDLEDVVGYLHIKPSQIRWLTRTSLQPEHKDIVVFLGCSIRVMPDKILALLDILSMIGMDFIALGGGDLCCGGKYLRSGELAKADRAARGLLLTLSAFKPKKVAFWCGTCLYEVTKVFPAFAQIGFQSVHISRLIADEIHRLRFRKSIEAKVVVHDPCNLSRKGGDLESVRKIIGAIPGVTLMEMAHNKENSLCCGDSVKYSYPDIAMTLRERVLSEVEDTGAQILATVCHGCHRSFCREQQNYHFEIKNYITLVADAAGSTHEDKHKQYLQMANIDEIIDEARDYIEASPYGLKDFEKLLPLYFGFAES